MKLKSILVIKDKGSLFNFSQSMLGNVKGEIDTVSGYEAAVDAFSEKHYHVVICAMKDAKTQIEVLGRVREKDYWVKTIAIASNPLEDYLAAMASQHFCFHILSDASEIPTTLDKMFGDDIFGIDKYVPTNVKAIEIGIRDSADKANCIKAVVNFVSIFNKDERITNAAVDIVDELIMNAIYDAPCDDKGQPLYAATARNDRVIIPEEKRATLKCAYEGRYLVISMTDVYGRLQKAALLNHLIRCVTATGSQVQIRPGGSGVGLYKIILSYVSNFIINLDPKKKTEVICLIDLKLSMRDFQKKFKTFQLFGTEDDIEISQDLSAVKENSNDLLSIGLSGVIDENSIFARIFETDMAKIKIDVYGIKRINSCGVREWVNAITDIPQEKELEIVRCSSAMVKQFNMITNFGGSGKVISFMAPYLCSQCNKRIEHMITIKEHLKDLLSLTAPRFTCDDCHRPLEFDDLEERYFQFVIRQESAT